MKNFLVLLEQSGGCDYTIGCGKKWVFCQAENQDDLMEKLRNDWDNEGCGIITQYSGERGLSAINICEISDLKSVFKELNDQAQLEIRTRKKNEEDEEKKQLYLKLKKELGL